MSSLPVFSWNSCCLFCPITFLYFLSSVLLCLPRYQPFYYVCHDTSRFTMSATIPAVLLCLPRYQPKKSCVVRLYPHLFYRGQCLFYVIYFYLQKLVSIAISYGNKPATENNPSEIGVRWLYGRRIQNGMMQISALEGK